MASKEPPIESGSTVSLVVEASDTSVKRAGEAPRLKKDSWTQVHQAKVKVYLTF